MNTGVRVGIMTPDPKLVLFEATCPHCWHVIRDCIQGHVGQITEIRVTCQCGKHFETESTAKELDS